MPFDPLSRRPAMRVLAIDPDAAFLTAVQRVVESSRCRVDCVSNAAEVGYFLERYEYDLVIADAQMPGLPARDLFARLEKKVQDGLHLLLLASEPPDAALQALLDQHRLTCLPKPLHLRRFLDKIEDLLLLAAHPEEQDD
jgi:DNA-binding response OmpR family regulator